MLSYEDIILLGEERILVIQEHKDGKGRQLLVRSDQALTSWNMPCGRNDARTDH
ncbi:hypothetical protein [Arthrobacter sp. R-11]|uniref:hypothetical protein n=1 Tax=Arthrobacter sp. R-11 TaxID=3404053 RepID=UPI003CE76ED8